MGKNLFKFTAGFLGNKTSCKNIREKTWAISPLLKEVDKYISDIGYLKKEVKNAKTREDLNKDFDLYLQEIDVCMKKTQYIMHFINSIMLFNCAIYYGFWKRLKTFYTTVESMKKSVDTKEKAQHLKTIITDILKIESKLLKELHKDELHEQLDIRTEGRFHIAKIEFRSPDRLNEKIRIESDSIDQITEGFDQIMVKLRHSMSEKNYEKLLKDGIKANHNDIRYAQSLTVKVEGKKNKIKKEHLNWIRDNFRNRPEFREKVDLIEKEAMDIDNDIKKCMEETFANMLKELNLLSGQKD